MKKIAIVFVLLLGGRAFTQPQTPAQKSAANAKNLLPTLSPQSPNVASLGRYGEYPVGTYTGVPNISIPIYDIKAGSVSVPIQLSYHASGIKVADVPSWVGLGWSLSAGGSVSRTIVGLPDDQFADGYLDFGIPTDLTSAGPDEATCEQRRFTVQRMLDGRKDSGADIFQYNFPTTSGRFILRRNGLNNFTAVSIPANRDVIKIRRQTNLNDNTKSWIDQFKITDENGITYTCDIREASTPDGGVGQYNTWLLTAITGPNPTEEVRFEYQTNNSYYSHLEETHRIVVHDQISGQAAPVGQGLDINSSVTSYTGYISNPVYLSSIVFAGGKITFDRETNFGIGSDDTRNASNKALDKINILGYNFDTQGFTLLKSYDLTYGYFANNNPARLQLTGVNMLDKNGVTIGKYSFNYNDAVTLPPYTSRARDMWGYYNGQTTNTSTIPNMQITVEGTNGSSAVPLVIGGGNRSVSEVHAQAGILTQINFPTGGFTKFVYESNRYKNNAGVVKLAGGLRIKTIESCPDAACISGISKEYVYGDGRLNLAIRDVADGSDLSQAQYQSLMYSTQMTKGYYNISNASSAGGLTCVPMQYRTRTFVPNYGINMLPYEGSPVAYKEVIEYDGKAANHNGYTIYKYRDSRGDVLYPVIPYSNKTITKSYDWDRGQLLSKTIKNKNNKLVAETINTYANLKDSTTGTVGLLIGYYTEYLNDMYAESPTCNKGLEIGGPGTNKCLSHFAAAQYFRFYYDYPVGNTRPTETLEYSYPSDGSELNPFVQRSKTFYDSQYFIANEFWHYQSDNRIGVKKVLYPQDYTANLPVIPTDIHLKGLRNLLNKNQIKTPIEEYSLQKLTEIDPNPTVLSSKQTLYFEPANLTGYAFPRASYLLELSKPKSLCPTGTDCFTASKVVSGAFVRDAAYNLHRVYFENYDNYGNLTELSTPDDATNSSKTRQKFDWTVKPISHTLSSGAFSTYQSVINAETKNFGRTPSLTTNYVYGIPLEGVKSVVAPNGLTMSYNYDSFSRLDNIKNAKGQIVKSYKYNYRPQ